jgi:hypothetical protein
MVYQPKYFLKNLPKYENLGRNGIWRQPITFNCNFSKKNRASNS